FEDDVYQVVKKALEALPRESTFYQCIADVIQWHKEHPSDWKETWFEIQKKWSEDIGCPNGVFQPLNIEAKLNAAYVVMALLYGNRDFFQTMDIATRAGQDSDCNPATACGILGTMIGYKNIPDTWLLPLQRAEDKVFSYSSYALNDIYDVNMRLAVDHIVKQGGRIEGADVVVQSRPSDPVAFVENFAGHRPTERVMVADYKDSVYQFDFEGIGVVVSGHLVKTGADIANKIVTATLYIDGEEV